MNELKAHDFHGKKVVDSRDVAQMVDRPHNDLMKSIRQYVKYLNEGEISQVDFFIESTYTASNGQEQPNFLITKKGCDMVANKMNGKKGVLFTAAYVSAFEEMRQTLTTPPVPKRIPDVSPSGLAKLITVTRQVMLDMGNSPVEIGAMTKSVLETWGIPVPVAFSQQIPGQLCLFENSALGEGRGASA
ncbi:hypothetical protein D1159_03860 [Pseudoflavonifractor sp. 524-17]|uniref:Rha family transcriptional regulator n=1 Tax=Pseudoflavonifractor sp. 524-17 TaxID=2304577 RepID=UPI00137B822B|nr:Rha family transcriptional regulator [Pseudoflavonifractor sp. 524-17]NCE63735.1 hypothetical protein [Pseudoflavonifractor sp. 524-17]